MLRTFVIRFSRLILKKRCSEGNAALILEQAMRKAGHSFTWMEDLRRQRATFFHETAPWIAMEIKSRQPSRYELIVLNENVADLEKDPNCVSFEAYRQIWLGLQACAADVQRVALAMIGEAASSLTNGG